MDYTVEKSKSARQTGNKCGHKPFAPRYFEPPEHHKNRKPFLANAIMRISASYTNPFQYTLESLLFYHPDKLNKDGGYRKARSEKVEMATTLFGSALFHSVNLGKMALGYFNDKLKEFIYFDFDYYAKLLKTSLKRVYRIAAVYVKAGYIEIKQRRKKLIDGSYKSLSPIIKINPKIFTDLGIDPKVIKFHVERGEKELNKKEKKASIENTEERPATIMTPQQRESGIKNMKLIMQALAKKLCPS